LSSVMRRSHELLEIAKNKGGRNALALELDKRSGGGRIVVAQWNEAVPGFINSCVSPCLLDNFIGVGNAIGRRGKRSLSASLAYRLEELRPGLEAIAANSPEEMPRFLAKQLERSGTQESSGAECMDDEREQLAHMMTALLLRKDGGRERLRIDTESIIIAKFIGTMIAKRRQGKNACL
jgi:CRISPR-associated protein Cmr2